MKKHVLWMGALVALLLVAGVGDGWAQTTPSEGGTVLRLGRRQIQAQFRRPRVSINVARLAPEVNVKSQTLKTFEDEIKEQPKRMFYLGKSEVPPAEVKPREVLKRRRE